MAVDPRAKVPLRAMNSEVARRAAEAAQAKAREFGQTISVAVCDESGNLVYFLRGDSCSFITFETSKARRHSPRVSVARPTIISQLLGRARHSGPASAPRSAASSGRAAIRSRARAR